MDEKIIIFMCTYNGESYLSAQIDSFASQTFPNWELWVSDDGSTDNTLSHIKNYQAGFPNQIQYYSRCWPGFAQNFLSLALRAQEQSNPIIIIAFADQDDVWEPSKLERALDWLKQIQNQAALYCSRTRLVNAQGGRNWFFTSFQ